jgi:nitrogen-specific signal transduction histidine kinase
MADPMIAIRSKLATDHIESDILLNAITTALIAINEDNKIIYANTAAEQFFKSSAEFMANKKL